MSGTLPATDNIPDLERAGTQRVHLAYLDGLRGLAALYVLLGHAFVSIRPQLLSNGFSSSGMHLLKLLDLGHYAVAVFIVLSGYCLTLPIVQSEEGRLKGGVGNFIKRRARRIMPPYFAALLLSVLLLILVPSSAPVLVQGTEKIAPLDWRGIVTHLLLIHNLFPIWGQAINGPMWSVAMEWQIYFLLPLVFLPLWRYGGGRVTLLAGLVMGLLPHFLLPERWNFDWTFPWYITLFVLGMWAAYVNFVQTGARKELRERLPWDAISISLIVAMSFLLLFRLRWAWSHLWFSDLIVGLTTASLLITCTRYKMIRSVAAATPYDRAARPLIKGIVHFLQSRVAAALGVFSYSLYLVHMPLLSAVKQVVDRVALPSGVLVAAEFLIVVPLILVAGYVFSLAFEQPFIRSRSLTR